MAFNIQKILPATVFDITIEVGEGQDVKEVVLDSLKISNLTQEGPEKTARGGKNNAILARYGKTARLEIEDAVINLEAVDALFGTKTTEVADTSKTISVSQTFPTTMKISGSTFFIDPDSGERVQADITIHKFLPDGLLNLTMEAEGDFGVFEIGGELFANKCGEFYNIKLTEFDDDCTDNGAEGGTGGA